jgi:ADP-ribosyl-[dinitrogen reductase] hydrolase
MYGAIAGDMAGSIYEFSNIKTTEFNLLGPGTNYTDDSILTVAVANWLLTDKEHTMEGLGESLRSYARKFPCPMGGYGGRFSYWLSHGNPQPYNSWGNGSAMRVSAVGWAFDTLEKTLEVAKISAEITHNHPEGIKGAQATAAAIFLARQDKSKEDIKTYITETFGYNLNRTCDEIRPVYKYNESCQGTVPEAIVAFLDSVDFESTLRLGVSLGGDSDTLTCIAGGIAEAYYGGVPESIKSIVIRRLETGLADTERQFYETFVDKVE